MNTQARRKKIESYINDIFDAEFYEASGLMQGDSVEGVSRIESSYVHGHMTLESAVEELWKIKRYYV